MLRALPIALVLGLVAITTAAFLRTETLKATRAPIWRPDFERSAFAPTCSCPTRLAQVSFGVRRRDPVGVRVIDEAGMVVRDLGRLPPEALTVQVAWDGRRDDGALAPDGTYRLRVALPSRRKIDMPNRLVLDTRAPQVQARLSRRDLWPERAGAGDGRGDVIYAFWRSDEQLVSPSPEQQYLDETRLQLAGPGGLRLRIVAGRRRKAYTLGWRGRLPGGRAVPEGAYALTLHAYDRAGNETTVALGDVQVRYGKAPR